MKHFGRVVKNAIDVSKGTFDGKKIPVSYFSSTFSVFERYELRQCQIFSAWFLQFRSTSTEERLKQWFFCQKNNLCFSHSVLEEKTIDIRQEVFNKVFRSAIYVSRVIFGGKATFQTNSDIGRKLSDF